MPQKLIKDVHLGDGVYASWDGFSIVLDLRAQAATTPITRIVMEPPVFSALLDFQQHIEKVLLHEQLKHDRIAP